jgi:phosphoglycerate dehydrogenase-like enzyme
VAGDDGHAAVPVATVGLGHFRAGHQAHRDARLVHPLPRARGHTRREEVQRRAGPVLNEKRNRRENAAHFFKAGINSYSQLPLGAIIGLADLVDCIPTAPAVDAGLLKGETNQARFPGFCAPGMWPVVESWPEVEMILSGWGMVPMDEVFFRRFPKLKVVFYAAGTVRGFVTEAFWKRDVLLTNAASANAVPVCEYTLSQVLFALKHGWQKSLYIRRHRKYPAWGGVPGAYQSTIGLLSLGEIGRLVAQRLLQFDLRVIAYDPYVSPDQARKIGVELLSLEEVFSLSDVVSCHTPWLEETEKMIRGVHFGLMRPGATFLNTARGQVVLEQRPDIFAVLDVTENSEPPQGSPLYTLENVVLTPHIAGSLGRECRRMGKLMVEELDRYLTGKPLRYQIDREQLARQA